MRPFLLSVSGFVVGIALTVIAFLFDWVSWPDPRRPQPWQQNGFVSFAHTHQPVSDFPPRIAIEHGVALDAEGAVDVGTMSETADGMRFGAETIGTNSDVRAILVWSGDAYGGSAAVLRFGPSREDVSVRVYSSSHMGLNKTWDHPRASIRLSDWPVDRPGTIVAFEIEGTRDAKPYAFDGKFRVPGGEESPAVDPVVAETVFHRRSPDPEVEPDVLILIDEQLDPEPVPFVEPTIENGYSARTERIPTSPDVLALRYSESDGMLGGIAVTLSLGPDLTDVRVRVDNLSDAGAPKSWTGLTGTMRVSSKALDREGVVVELELFGTYRDERQRFHARFLTPP